jgi:peptidoglycan/LPS O-acetylase OafA/YrhL
LTEPGRRPDRDYVAALTGLRGVAAAFVFCYHYAYFNPGIRLDLAMPLLGHVLQTAFGLGFVGVDLFFVLSGFLLSIPFAAAKMEQRPAPALGHYLQRRVLRVFPAYWAQLAVLLLAGAWFVSWRPLSGWDWPAHLLMVFNVGPEPVRPMVGVWWTLPVEFSFYLLLPLLAHAMRPRTWPWLLALACLCSIAWRQWSAQAFTGADPVMLAAAHLPGSLPEFLFGASASMLWLQARQGGGGRLSPALGDALVVCGALCSGLWLWCAVLGSGAAFWHGHWSMLVSPIVLGITLGALVLGSFSGSRLARVLFANRAVHALGLVSYSLYLWHFVVMQQLFRGAGDWLAGLGPMSRFALVSAVVMAIASASYWLFERPFFRLRGRRKNAAS